MESLKGIIICSIPGRTKVIFQFSGVNTEKVARSTNFSLWKIRSNIRRMEEKYSDFHSWDAGEFPLKGKINQRALECAK